MAFSKAQPFNLVETNEKNSFLLDTYEYETARGAGIAVWLYDNEIPPSNWYGDRRDAMFIVKLVPPYISTEEMIKNDSIEGKPYRAIINKIYVDIVGIWVYKQATGEIVRKESGDKK